VDTHGMKVTAVTSERNQQAELSSTRRAAVSKLARLKVALLDG
jgi:hypothetical protein